MKKSFYVYTIFSVIIGSLLLTHQLYSMEQGVSWNNDLKKLNGIKNEDLEKLAAVNFTSRKQLRLDLIAIINQDQQKLYPWHFIVYSILSVKNQGNLSDIIQLISKNRSEYLNAIKYKNVDDIDQIVKRGIRPVQFLNLYSDHPTGTYWGKRPIFEEEFSQANDLKAVADLLNRLSGENEIDLIAHKLLGAPINYTLVMASALLKKYGDNAQNIVTKLIENRSDFVNWKSSSNYFYLDQIIMNGEFYDLAHGKNPVSVTDSSSDLPQGEFWNIHKHLLNTKLAAHCKNELEKGKFLSPSAQIAYKIIQKYPTNHKDKTLKILGACEKQIRYQKLKKWDLATENQSSTSYKSLLYKFST